MKQFDRINEIMNKEPSAFKRRQMIKILREIEMEWEQGSGSTREG